MKISIVTPMYNSGQYICRMIQALKDIDYPKENLEIIIIDNGSTDDSVKIVREKGVFCLIMTGASVSQMRNKGASMATGEILGFVDSDCIVGSDWAIRVVENIADDIGIIGGYYGVGDSPGWIEETWYDLKKDIKGDVSFVSAGNMAVKAKIFSKVGGFDGSIETGEDWDLCQRVIAAGYRVVNQPSLHVVHLGNHKTLLGIIKKERWYGRGMFAVLKGKVVTKPLLVSFVFIFLCLIFILFLVMQSYKVVFVTLMLIFILICMVSYNFIGNVKDNRFSAFIKCIPISLCYVIGRSLSVSDIIKDKIFGAGPDN